MFTKGDTVALFMENRIEYIPIWLGMAKGKHSHIDKDVFFIQI